MLRALLIYLSQAPWARKIVMNLSIARRVSSRFVAGETLGDAVAAIKTLNEQGMFATFDHLGEFTSVPEEAKEARDAAIRMIDAIVHENLQSGISIKLTQIGMGFDPVLCAENLAYILSYAQQYGVFVRIDMEDSSYTTLTFDIFNEMWNGLGMRNVGMVLQSYLYRSEKDLRQLMSEGVRVRMTKGAYREPPEVSYQDKSDVDQSFDQLVDIMMKGTAENDNPVATGRLPAIPAIASHDEERIEYAKLSAARHNVPKNALEFQMLFGIRREIQEALVKEGYPVRIYVPYGTQWYPYFMRRLAERPANLWFFVSNLLRR
jgi:proline dehydrogenase